MAIVHGFFLIILLIIVARLLELQVVRAREFKDEAANSHSRRIAVAAKRGEILGRSSKTNEENIFATNVTLDLLYVDPLIATNPRVVADTLAEILVTPDIHAACTKGEETCPRELINVYQAAFDPVTKHKLIEGAALLEPLPAGQLPPSLLNLPDLSGARRTFADYIAKRISEKRVTFTPIAYGATKIQMAGITELAIPGVSVDTEQALISANPELVPQTSLPTLSRRIADILQKDPEEVASLLRSRPLRYVPIMRRLTAAQSLQIKEAQLASLKEAIAAQVPGNKISNGSVEYPFRSVALLPEQWRFYPDTTIASHIVGFVNVKQEPQYGIERTYQPQLRGQEGFINTVSDLTGGQILTSQQTIVDPLDGDSIVLTLDRTVQKKLEQLMSDTIEKFDALSGQAIVMDPYTGRLIAVVNVPLFDGNNYANVFEKDALTLSAGAETQIVVEVEDPKSHVRVVRAFKDDIFTASGRTMLSEKSRTALDELEKLYELKDITRYYQYTGVTNRREIFPTDTPGLWLKFKNDIGVGAYLNRAVQEIYEPGSVLKPIIMAIGIDQGEVRPEDIYEDFEDVKVDEYTIKNALLVNYGKVTMTNCMEFSINTCMTSVSFKLGARLLHHALELFGFGKITGVEMENELPGEMQPWREWSRSLLATTSFGQGISATPIQVVTAFSALANGGKLMKPTIIDRVIHSDGTVDVTRPVIVEQAISQRASETITAMLVSSVDKGFAKAGRVPGYKIAGKTGTSQIAGPGGKYETGTGSTVATFAGYAPVTSNPRFVILVKIDRPKKSVFGVEVAAPVFRDISKFLLEYYGISPDGPR